MWFSCRRVFQAEEQTVSTKGLRQSWLVSGTAKSLCGWSGLKGERVVEYDIIELKEPGHIQKWPSTF